MEVRGRTLIAESSFVMKKILKVLSFLGIALVLFFAALLLAFYHLVQVGEFRRFLISEFERRTKLKVEVGEAELEMGRVVGISFRDFALLGPQDRQPAVAAQRVLLRVRLLPLLKRRIVFYEVRFYQPKLQIIRQGEGGIPLLDLFLQLPFQGQKGAEFALDLRQVRVEKGEVIFVDQREDKGATLTQLREIDMNLRRIQKKEPPVPGSGVAPKVATPDGAGPAADFDIKSTIEKDGKRAWVKSKGKILFSQQAVELRQAWLDAEIQVEALPVDLFWDYYGHLLPLKALHGALGSRLRWQGSLAERVQLKGEIDFKRLEVDATNILPNVIAPGDGRLELEMEWTPRAVRLQRLDLRSREIRLNLRGSMRSLVDRDPYLELHLTTPFLPLSTARNYVPLALLKSPLEPMITTANQGEIRLVKAGVAGRLSEIRRILEPGFGDHIWLDAEVKGVGGNPTGGPYLPVRDVSGQIVLEKGVLYYKGLKGAYGLSRLEEIEGAYKGVLTGHGPLDLRIRGEADLGELREQSKLDFFPPSAAKFAASLQELSGKGKFAISVQKESASSPRFEGQFSLENARLRTGDVSLSQVRGGLSFSPKEIRAVEITALLSGSPLSIRLTLSNYLSDSGTFDLTAESSGVKAGTVGRILLSSGSPEDPGTVRGAVRYQGSLTSSENRKLSGSLDLLGVQLPLKLFTQPLREVVGKVKFDGRGIDFQAIKGRVVGSAFDFSGQWSTSEASQLTFTASSPEMDLGQLLSQIDGGSDDRYDRFQAKGSVSIGKGRYEGFEFSDLKTDLVLDQRQWRFNNFSARSLGGTIQGAGSFVDSRDGVRFSVEPKIAAIPVKGFLGWFDMGTTEITGKVNLTGNFDSSGKTGLERKRNLNGSFHLQIEDGVAQRFRILVQILNLLDLSRWFSLKMPDINQQGIRFRSVTGDFKVSRGVYSTQNLFVDSDDLRITGAGKIDVPKGDVDFVVAVRPFPRLDSAVNFIPLIGQGLAAIKNSLLVASFHITGPVADPAITPAPLSTLSEFFYGALAIPKSIIGRPGDEKK